MIKQFILIATFCLIQASAIQAQNIYYTKSGNISMKCSKSALERIEAINKSSTCVLDTKSGLFRFSVLLKGFEFEKALMQEHFNENYAESDRYPRSDFEGQIINNNEINYSVDGNYTARVKGKLHLHGQTEIIETTGNISIDKGMIFTRAHFNLSLSDFNISIPSLVMDKVANTSTIEVDCILEPLKNSTH